MIKDIRPGLKNINVVFMVLEKGTMTLTKVRKLQAHTINKFKNKIIFFRKVEKFELLK